MRKRRRKVLSRIVEGAALALLLGDAILYWALVYPLRQKVAAERQQRGLAQGRIQAEQSLIEVLRKHRADLPIADKEIEIFLRDHVPSRRRGFSRAAGLLRQVTQESGVQLSSVSYRLDTSGDQPLKRLGIVLTAEGPFEGLLKFAHALETASDFILVRDFGFQPGENGNLALRMGAELYLAP